MTIDPTYLNKLILVLTGFGGAFLAALWVSSVIWTYRDIKSRARDNLVFILAPLLVAVLSLPGLLIYLVLRPQFTLEEEYQKTLEEEALLQAIEDLPVCPGCERKIESDWQLCPNCHTKLRKTCQNCGNLMELPWNVCPFCATLEYGLRTEDMNQFEQLEAKKENIEIDTDPLVGSDHMPSDNNDLDLGTDDIEQ